ncbi:hypothetical protein [Phaeobacter piscinae]|uniref:hypothetical protein n=1 Tax=Phaeobacter piscinae TaxID=1580596 RepID=UPI000BBE4444|nr:hypothetical protein [Phaeobacter piscinae]ATG41708.1 hypothetical protein PhaeoP14_03676 [Phaeobacter piscinae]AUR38131.1 hypothetical protein PhaeoP18_03915 [Phaeobacter piscinae]
MLNRSLSLALLAVLLGSGANAQSFMDRAAAAADGAVNTGSTFRDETINEVVTPFETSRPPEAGMNHTTFEDRILETRDADNDQGRVLRATEDSAIVRPDIDIDGQGELFDDANWAHENAEDIAGRYFSSETGSCTTPEVPVSDVRDEFCESLPAREEKTCRLIRKIWVDRTDTYRCDRRAANFVKVCEKTQSYSCRRNGSVAACIRRNVKIEGGDVTWNGRVATISFPAPGRKPKFAHPSGAYPATYNYATLAKHQFNVRISDRFAPDEIVLKHVSAAGPVQITGNDGQPITTVAASVLSSFGTSSWGDTIDWDYPRTPEDGLLIPSTNTYGWETDSDGGSLHTAFIANYPQVRQCNNSNIICFNTLDYYASQTVFESGWDSDQESLLNSVGFNMHTWDIRQPHEYADLRHNTQVERNVIRLLELDHFATARPSGGKRFKSNNMTTRVVYNNATQGGGAAALRMEFSGSCCDRFVDTGSETCE